MRLDDSRAQPWPGVLATSVREELGLLQLLPSLVMDQICAMLLGPVEESALNARLYTLQAVIMEQCDLETSFFISRPLADLEQVHAGFLEACALFRLQVQHGSSTILFAARTPMEPEHPPWLPAFEQLEALLHAVHEHTLGGAEQALDGLLDVLYAGDLREHTLVFVCAKLLVDCLNTLQYFHMDDQTVSILSRVQLQDVSYCKGRSDVRAWILDRLIQPTIDALVRQQTEADVRLFIRIKEAISQHFEIDYSLEMCANDVACTAHALKRTLRNVVNMTYSAYLAKYRLDQAKQWLGQTDLRVADIAQRLRFSNAQNFVRSFRKQEGITPGEYRRIKR